MHYIIILLFIRTVGWCSSPPLEEAELRFSAALYADSLPLYRQSKPLEGSFRIHFGEALLEEKQLDEIIDYLEPIVLQGKAALLPQEAYILSQAYLQKENPDAASKILSAILDTSWNGLPTQDTVRLALAESYIAAKQFNDARVQLGILTTPGTSSDIRKRALLDLAKMAMAEKDNQEALKQLASLERLLEKKDKIHFELSYLRGKVFIELGDWSNAILAFESALPKKNEEKAEWVSDTLFHLGCCYLKKGQDVESLARAEDYLTHLYHKNPGERSILALSELYLARAEVLDDASAYEKAKELLADLSMFNTQEGKTQALLLRAQAAMSYEEREHLYRALTAERAHDPDAAMSWYLRGMNDFDEEKWDLAVQSLEIAYLLWKENDPAHAARARLYEAQAYSAFKSPEGRDQAIRLLKELLPATPTDRMLDNRDEIYNLLALIYIHSGRYTDAIETLNEGLNTHPLGKFNEANRLLLAKSYLANAQPAQAEEQSSLLLRNSSNSNTLAEAWYNLALAADNVKDIPKKKERLQQIYLHYPQTPLAPRAYFTYYTYREYLQGDRDALKHLQMLDQYFPQSPYAIIAAYLLGLDATRDRRTPEGRWISRKNLLQSIELFHRAESLYDLLVAEHRIQEEDASYWRSVRDQAVLERALANLSVAQDSQGAKRKIYLEYAEEVFKNLLGAPHTKEIAYRQEVLYGLAQVYLEGAQLDKAAAVLETMEDENLNSPASNGYFLCRALFEQAMIKRKQQKEEEAYSILERAALVAGQSKIPRDQRLEIWIEQSLCLKEEKKYDQSILMLSKVINDDAVSGLRIKAMLLRADIYELQERYELARKQLEAVVKKGGEWGKLATERLERNYGYQ